MDKLIKQDTAIPENKFAQAPCGECDRRTRHKILANTSSHWTDAEGLVDVWLDNKIIQCQGCLTISFCEVSCCSEELGHDQDGKPFLEPTNTYFPNRITGRPMMQGAMHLPRGVYVIYQEAHAALCAELNIMAGFGIRAIVESVCKDKEMKGFNLAEKIDSLESEGLITESGSKILHSLRFMGNAAAHEMRTHSNQELHAAFDVAEYLLQGVYVLPTKAEKLPSGDG